MQGGDRAGPRAAVVGVVRQPLAHQQRAEVRVAQPELAVGARVVADPLGRVAGRRDDDLLGREHHAHRVAEVVDREGPVLAEELHEVDRRQVAGRVVDVHVLAARVGAGDAARRSGWCASAGWCPRTGRPGRRRPTRPRRSRAGGSAAGISAAVSPPATVLVCHGSPASTRAEEVVGEPHRVVGVLELDRAPGVAVQAEVVAHLAEGVGLGLLVRLGAHELQDVRVVGVEDHHLRGAAGAAAGLDRARAGVGPAHEADRPRGLAAVRQRLAVAAQAATGSRRRPSRRGRSPTPRRSSAGSTASCR